MSACRAIAASICSRVMPSVMSGFCAIDFSVMCGTRLQTNPLLMSFVNGPSGFKPVSFCS